MEYVIYVVLAIILVGDLVAAHFINKKRCGLDLAKPEDAAKEKKLRMIILALHVECVAMAAIVLLVVKPMVITAL